MADKPMVEWYMPLKRGGFFPEPFDSTPVTEVSIAASLANDYGCDVAMAARILRTSKSDLRRVLWTIRQHGYGDMPLADVLPKVA